ncbi:MAG: hypothetical protein H5T86_01915, partial [Armatimonadetes bacterium]|nr:hypothetical protein [Armatimonadota bacterium]
MILAVLTGLAMIQQAPEPAAMRLNLKPLWRAPGPVRVPIGDDVTTATLQLPPLPHAPGQRLIIRFRARLTTTAFGGWNEYLALVVNGQVAGPRTVEGVLRLINRPPFWRADYRGKRWMSVWENRNGYPCLNVWFSHTYDQMDPRVLDPAGELYWYALDITDLAQRDKPNEIKLVNTALARYFGGADKVKDVFLEVDSLEVGVAGARDVEIIRARREVVRRPLRGPSAVGSGWSALACPGGGIQIRAAGQHFYIETSYRVLGQQLELRCQPEPLGWDVRTSAGGGSLQVLAHADRLEVRRTVTPAAHRLIIEDQVANRTHNDLGVVVEHTAIASSPFRAVRLMGQDTAAVSPPWGAENCTVHARTDHAGLGILVLDDFFRCHFSALTQDNWILLADEHFALAAGESYRFRLAVYPATGDRAAAPTAVQEAPTSYWVFLNQVRRDIGANFTIDGPFEFLDSRSELVKDARKLRAYLARKPVRLFALS